MKKTIEKLLAHEMLTREEAREVLIRISAGDANEMQMAAFMTVYLMRSISVQELAGFREALLSLCTPVSLQAEEAIDLCGTGGDGKNTFNISTLASFVVAGAGGKVIKHGNYGVSGISGSSNVLEHFGYCFPNTSEAIRKQYEELGIAFIHAPLFHPALRTVAPVRKALGVKTFFNMLGPLVNPAQPGYRLTGVFSLELARTYRYLLQETNEKYIVLHSSDGYDEFSLTSPVHLFSNTKEEVLCPESLGFSSIQPVEIFGGSTVEAAADVFLNILENKGTRAQENTVIANAALALQCLGLQRSLAETILAAKESLHSGKAKTIFQKLIQN
jgi:anthranilate phosphoribosyltransferase